MTDGETVANDLATFIVPQSINGTQAMINLTISGAAGDPYIFDRIYQKGGNGAVLKGEVGFKVGETLFISAGTMRGIGVGGSGGGQSSVGNCASANPVAGTKDCRTYTAGGGTFLRLAFVALLFLLMMGYNSQGDKVSNTDRVATQAPARQLILWLPKDSPRLILERKI